MVQKTTTFSKYLIASPRSITSECFLALAKHIIQELIKTFPSSVVDITLIRNSFFTSTAIEWNKLDLTKRNSEICTAFQKSIFKFISPSSNSISSANEIKLVTRLRLGLSYFRDHKFRHNFQDTSIPICFCGDGNETTIRYLLLCPNQLEEKRTLLDNLQSLKKTFMIKMISKSQNCFYLAFLQITMHHFECYHAIHIGY